MGKEIGGAIYVHRRYEHLLGAALREAKQQLPLSFDYTVVKYHMRDGAVSFIASPDFDTAPEPVVGEAWIVRGDGRLRRSHPPTDPFLYHHKWLFVRDDYEGFDVAESKARSAAWIRLDPPVDRSRIGRQSYWQRVVLPRLSAATS